MKTKFYLIGLFFLAVSCTEMEETEIKPSAQIDYVAPLLGNYRTIDSVYDMLAQEFRYQDNNASTPHNVEIRRDSILLGSTKGLMGITKSIKIDSMTDSKIYNVSKHPITQFTTYYNGYLLQGDTLFMHALNPEAMIYIRKD